MDFLEYFIVVETARSVRVSSFNCFVNCFVTCVISRLL